jgi:hypothetical protein
LIGRTVNGQPAAPIVAGGGCPSWTPSAPPWQAWCAPRSPAKAKAGRLILRNSRLKDGETNPDGWKRLIDGLMRARHLTKASGRKAARS